MIEDPEPVDLSPLDPGRDPARWALLVEATSRRVAAALEPRSREPDPLEVVSRWARPILAAAAILTLLLGVAAAMLGPRARPAATETHRLARLTEESVTHGRLPTGGEVMAAIARRRS